MLNYVKKMPVKTTRLIASTALALILTSCTLTHSPDTNIAPLQSGPASFTSGDAAPQDLGTAWYQSFNDPKLADLINRALENNYDVAQAFARLQQAEAIAAQSGTRQYPSADLTAGTNKSWQDGSPREGYSSGGAALSWEVDLFNRLGSAAAADRYERDAAAADLDAVRLALTATLAENYYSAVAQHMQIELLRAQLAADNKFLDLIRQRQREGIGTRLNTLQQEGEVADTASLIPPAEAALRAYENRLDVLLGMPPDSFNRTAADKNFAKIGTLPPIGVPSDLLLNRPDLRALRLELIAADADIGTAIADQLPRITLTGSFIMADGAGPAGPAIALLGNIVQPLLDWGRRKAEIERNKALYNERLAAFTQAYLTAIEDVENALYREDRQREFISRLEDRRRILAATVTTAQQVFNEGLSDYLPVLDAMGDLRSIERTLLQERRNLVLQRIALYRAIGAPIPPHNHNSEE